MDKVIKREVGIWALLIVGFFGVALFGALDMIELHPLWMFFITASWYTTEILCAAIIYHYFRVTKDDIPNSKTIPG